MSKNIKNMKDAFEKSTQDMYGIYQLKRTEEAGECLFMSMSFLRSRGKKVDGKNYELVYAGLWNPELDMEHLYEMFNVARPEDFRGHSLSVSDVIVIRKNGLTEAYFVDSIGFEKVTLEFCSHNLTQYAVAIEDRFLAIQQVDDGYDYTIYRDDFTEFDGGIYDDPDMTIEEAFCEILNDMIADEVNHPRVWHSEVTQIDYDLLDEYACETAQAQLKGEKAGVISLYKKKTNLFFRSVDYRDQQFFETYVWSYVISKIEAEDLDLDIKIKDVVLTGSRCRGLEESSDSDMDFLVEYESSDFNEDFLFNFLHEDNFEISGIKVDINPIREEETGTLEEHLPKHEKYLADKRTLQALERTFPLQNVVEKLKEKGHNARVENICKGDLSYQGISIVRYGVSPVIRYEYLLQEKGMHGWTLERIADAVLELHEKNIVDIPDAKRLQNPDFVIPRLHICLQKSSDADLEKRPFELTDGIEEYLSIFMEDENGEIISAKPKKGSFEQIGLATDIAWKIAEENNVKDTRIITLPSFVGSATAIVSNKYQYRGAACIRNMDALKKYAAENGYTGKFIVCPASVNEMFLYPVETLDNGKDLEFFSKIVNKANQNDLPPEYRLADHAFWIEV